MYANFQENIFLEISGKKLRWHNYLEIWKFFPDIPVKIFFLKIGKYILKNVPNIEVDQASYK